MKNILYSKLVVDAHDLIVSGVLFCTPAAVKETLRSVNLVSGESLFTMERKQFLLDSVVATQRMLDVNRAYCAPDIVYVQCVVHAQFIRCSLRKLAQYTHGVIVDTQHVIVGAEVVQVVTFALPSRALLTIQHMLETDQDTFQSFHDPKHFSTMLRGEAFRQLQCIQEFRYPHHDSVLPCNNDSVDSSRMVQWEAVLYPMCGERGKPSVSSSVVLDAWRSLVESHGGWVTGTRHCGRRKLTFTMFTATHATVRELVKFAALRSVNPVLDREIVCNDCVLSAP